MKRGTFARLLAGALASTSLGNAAAQEDAVVVTATPSRSNLFDLVAPADVLAGPRLSRERRSTLGETLGRVPGISATGFGPQVSRPIIRGLDGDRIRILQNGVGTHDASSLSFDHAVPYDPLAAERVEVVRGPAAVLYGGNAVGGVVNVIDNRIPDTPVRGFTGHGEGLFGGADRARSASGSLEAGNGTFALHADGFVRRTRDLEIPGFARSARQRAADGPGIAQSTGRLPNSDARSSGGTLGGSVDWSDGYLGLAYQGYESNYGSVPEPAVRVDMQSERRDLAGELRPQASLVTGIKFKLGRTDYRHDEIDAGTVGTMFRSRGSDGRLEVSHDRLGPLTGALGVTFNDTKFSALGAEAFVPSTDSDSRAFFVYEEAALGALKLSGGVRGERARIRSAGSGPADPATGLPRFDPPQTRSFSVNSSAFGALYRLNDALALAGNLSFTQRAPTFYELFANGPHAATGAYEVGTAGFDKERSRSLDAGLRWRSGPNSASVSAYRTRFRNFIALARSGNTRGADGELNPADADGDEVADGSGEEILPELVWAQVPARFTGFEAQAHWQIYERSGSVDLELKGDLVRATDLSTGAPLPRISPRRLGAGLQYTLNRFSARIDVVYAAAQNRVAPNELPTDSYTLTNLYITYRLAEQPASLTAFLRVDNLFDREAREHSSFLKDQAPRGGRAIVVGLRGSF
jgi:iron complex outermembrane receptor protein